MKTPAKKQKRVQCTDKRVEESLSYTVEVRDKNGRVLQRISAPSRSYVQQWNQVINAQAAYTLKSSKDTGGVVKDVGKMEDSLQADAAIGVITYGLRVGKGTTAVAITDYALGSPCGEGTGTDEFNHQVMQFTGPSVAGSTCSFTLTRTMINNSGATISGIKELACYVVSRSSFLLGFRDVLPGALSVPDGGSITVTYTIAVTV